MSSGKKNDKSNRDKAMASYMKANGISRTGMACPLCHHDIGASASALFAHFASNGCRSTHISPGRARELTALPGG